MAYIRKALIRARMMTTFRNTNCTKAAEMLAKSLITVSMREINDCNAEKIVCRTEAKNSKIAEKASDIALEKDAIVDHQNDHYCCCWLSSDPRVVGY